MATQADYIEYIKDQLCSIGDITARKMFGEYMIYVNQVPLLLVCDNQVFVKINEVTKELLGEFAKTDFPYPTAKLHYVLNPDNREELLSLVDAIATRTPQKVNNLKNEITK